MAGLLIYVMPSSEKLGIQLGRLAVVDKGFKCRIGIDLDFVFAKQSYAIRAQGIVSQVSIKQPASYLPSFGRDMNLGMAGL